jgi:hypothetical protein
LLPDLSLNLIPVKEHQRFDVRGALIMTAALGCYAMGMTLGQNQGFNSPLTLSLLFAAGLGLAALLFVEQRTDQPMIDLSLFRNPLFSLNLLMGVLVFIVLSASFILPSCSNWCAGIPTELVGMLMMAFPVTMGLVAPLSGHSGRPF